MVSTITRSLTPRATTSRLSASISVSLVSSATMSPSMTLPAESFSHTSQSADHEPTSFHPASSGTTTASLVFSMTAQSTEFFRAARKGLRIEAHEAHVDGRIGGGRQAGLVDVGAVGLKLFEEAAGAEDEHAAVPEIVPVGQVGLGRRDIRLFDEAGDAPRVADGLALLDIAVARLGPFGDDPEGYEIAVPGKLDRICKGAMELRRVDDQMIGGERRDDRIVVVAHQGQRGAGQGRRRAPRGGLEQQRRVLTADLAQLLGSEEAVLLVAHDQGRGALDAGKARDGLLQHRRLAAERKELLRAQLPGKGPQARADSAGQDDGGQHRHVLPGRRFHGGFRLIADGIHRQWLRSVLQAGTPACLDRSRGASAVADDPTFAQDLSQLLGPGQ